MLTAEDVHKSIDLYMAADFTDSSVVRVLYGNTDDTSASEGVIPYIKQEVIFREAKQFELGNTDSARNWGVLVFILHVRKGSGSLMRDRLYQRMVNLFRSKKVGGATFLNVQPLSKGSNENWSMNGYQIPFFFNSI